MEPKRDSKVRRPKTYGKSAAKKIFSAAFDKLSSDEGFSRQQKAISTKTTLDSPRLPLSSLSTNLPEPSSPSPTLGYLSGKLPKLFTEPTWRDMGPVGYNKSRRQLAAQGSKDDASTDESNCSFPNPLAGGCCQNQDPSGDSKVHQLAARNRTQKGSINEPGDKLSRVLTNMDGQNASSTVASKAHQLSVQRYRENTRPGKPSDNLPEPYTEPVWRRMGPVGYSKSCRQLAEQTLKNAASIDELNDDLLKLSTSRVYRDQSCDKTYSPQAQLPAAGASQKPDNAINLGRLAKNIGKAKRNSASNKLSARNTELNSYENQLEKLCSLSINPSGPLEFQAWADIASQKLTVLKIAEASYGEVYRLQPKCGMETEAKDYHSVVKVIAIQPFRMPKNSKLKKSQLSPINEIISEVEVMDRMADIPGFVVFKGLHVVRGRLAKEYVNAWTAYHNIDPSRSLFPNPNNKSTYSKDQLWAIIEMEDAGDELSDVPVGNFIQAWDIFWGVTLAFAKGEDMARFEHRDLHTGNVCVTRPSRLTELNTSSMSTLSSRKFGLSGFTTTIIDYTLSRADMVESYTVDGESQSRVVFTDLDRDKALFEAEGEYQYDIYRMMRSSIYYTHHPDTLNIWQNYHPLTNVYWLHHLVVVLLKKIDISQNAKTALEKIKTMESFNLEETFHGDLLELERLINPKSGGKFATAGEIVAWALDRKWLKPADIDNVA